MSDSNIKIVVDVETTGLDFRKEKIIELAAVKLVNGEITETFESLVNPMQHIRHSSINIHGITEEMILEAPTIEEILPQFLDFIEDKPLIGHNVIFDYSFINFASLSLYGKELSNLKIDTLNMFKEVFPTEPSHGLSALLKKFNVETDTSHRAMADAYSLAKVYTRLRSLYEERISWQLSQIGNIHYLFERYLRIQSIIQTMQSEMGDLKSVFKVYFEEGGEPIEATSGELLTFSSKHNYQYDIVKLKQILDEINMADRILKINTGLIERQINNSSLNEDVRERLKETRINIVEQSSVVIQKPYSANKGENNNN